ncbi:MAG: MFS transporter [Rhabdochlamydiaceae bacterium]|nr:MFS transporter [Rhabdochlamydiaceae bacterium]
MAINPMFRSDRDYRTFLTILLTYLLDLVGFSIVFPVLAPLLLNPDLHFFQAGTLEIAKTTMLGFLFAVFGITQFFGAPIAGVLADHYGRYRIFLVTIALSFFGYLLMAYSIYLQSIAWLVVGRMVTGFCSGNFALAQSATADLTDVKHRGKAFGVLLGVGGLGFVAGPWIGGKLANPHWLFGSGAFLFAAIAALINFFMIYFFFGETWKRKQAHVKLLSTFKDIRIVLHQKKLKIILITYLLFSIGWGFFLVFSPTYLVQKFALESSQIGDIFAYMALIWFFVSMYLNKELIAKFSLRSLILTGALISSIGVALYVCPNTLWPYWFIIPIALLGGALCWVNLGTLLSVEASDEMQGRALGVSGSMWSIGQIVAPLIAGPLAGWNIYSPLLVGAICILLCLIYFSFFYHRSNTRNMRQ